MIRLANAPCSWGVLEFDEFQTSLTAAEYLRQLRDAGFAATELGDWGFMPTDPTQLADLLRAHAVSLVGAYVPTPLAEPEHHDDGIAAALRTARLLAGTQCDALLILADDNGTDPVRTANAGRITEQQALAPIRWRYVTHAANEIARIVREETGIRTAFHHHCAGWIETAEEVERLMNRTDPDLLGLCFDTGHWTFAGGDAVAGLNAHLDRVWHVHFKDCHPAVRAQAMQHGWDYFECVRRGVFCELGQGDVDFAGVLDALDDFDGTIVVEQDVLPGLGTPLESARRSRTYLQTLGLTC